MKKHHPNSEFLTLIFDEDFKPAYIWGSKKQLKDLGIKVTIGSKPEPWNWTYESPVLKMPKKKFKVEVDWDSEKKFCDSITFKNGVVFGNVDPCGFNIYTD